MKITLNRLIFSLLQDLLYDTTKQSGFLFNALKYENQKKRKATKAVELAVDGNTFTDEEKENILKYFKRCVLPKEQKMVMKKMKETKTMRRELILNDFYKYRECWQFYFVSPELVYNFHFIYWNKSEFFFNLILHIGVV